MLPFLEGFQIRLCLFWKVVSFLEDLQVKLVSHSRFAKMAEMDYKAKKYGEHMERSGGGV